MSYSSKSKLVKHPCDRRTLLLHSAASVIGVIASGCSKSPPATCPPSTLTADEANVRTALGYVDKTPEPGKPCVKCSQYVPAPAADQCGGCKLMKGLIHPTGYCRAFTPL